MVMMRFVVMVMAVLFLGAMHVNSSSLAMAQTAEDDAAARQLFEAGQVYYERGQFAEAARSFESAYALSRRYQLLHNAYLAHRDAQNTEAAARTLRLYLERGGGNVQNRAQLEARLQALDEKLREEQASREATETAEVAEAVQKEAQTQDNTSADTNSNSDTNSTKTNSERRANERKAAFTLLGVGGGMVIAGIVVAVETGSNCLGIRCSDSGRNTMRNVLLVGGGAAVVAGTVLFFLSREPDVTTSTTSTTSASAMCTHEGCAGSVTVQF